MAKRKGVYIFAVLWLGWIPLLYPQNQTTLREPARSDSVLVTIEKSGGFAGIHEKFKIHTDGRISNSDGIERRISVSQLQSIRRRITALDLPGSRRIELPAGICSDCFSYRITLRNPSGKIVLNLSEVQMGGQDSVSRLARSILDLVLRIKWR